MKIPRTKRAVALAALGGMAVIALPALAAAQVIPVPGINPASLTYTGCLRTSGPMAGQVFAVRQGDTPLRACLSTEREIKVSGGDITSVAAGTGLTVTPGTASDQFGVVGLRGDVGVQLADNYRLPQNCTPGQIPVDSAEPGWTCADDQLGPVVYGRSEDGGHIGDAGATIATPLSVPAGHWAITARVTVYTALDTDPMEVSCRLAATGTPHIAGANTAGSVTDQQLTFVGAVSSAEPFQVSVHCSDAGNVYGDSFWSELQITAVEGQNVQVVNL